MLVTGDLRILFKKVDYTLDNLLTYIEIGDIGLPDIQRPFVWSAAKIRDLFDSMYRGFPIGYLLFWGNDVGNGARQIGKGEKGHAVPKLLIVDGQQRLTSLYAVFRGKEVLDADYKHTKIGIAFRPRDGRFEVTDIAIRRDPEWIPDVSELWAFSKPIRRIVNEFIERLRAKRELTDEEEDAISHNLDRLFDLQKYPFTALEIASSVDEEHVAEIFVRINSQGVKLNQGDFILTLLSVFWDEGRAQLEEFCRAARTPPSGSKPSPYNHFINPDPDQLLRVSVAYGFRRGRLKSVYQLLRGKDLDTDQFSVDHREQQFAILRDAQAQVLNLTSWHQFFGALLGAGFRSRDLIGSQNTLMYAYAFYLLGKLRFGVSEHALQRVIGRWFFFTTITSRYIGSFETQVEADLALLRDVTAPEAFVAVLEKIMADDLTDDFWRTTLPSHLETSGINSPYLFAYLAAQNKLGAPVLFSMKKVAELLDPMVKVKMKSTNQHHLFPKAWLDRNGVSSKRDVNQIANLALTEWPDNLAISDEAPSVYLPEMRARFSPESWREMHELHALPMGWESMAYEQFLNARRPLMASVIRRAYESL